MQAWMSRTLALGYLLIRSSALVELREEGSANLRVGGHSMRLYK